MGIYSAKQVIYYRSYHIRITDHKGVLTYHILSPDWVEVDTSSSETMAKRKVDRILEGGSMRRNVTPRKAVSTHKFGGKTFYYAGRTLYPSKARLAVSELAEKGIKGIITSSRELGSMIWADEPTWVELGEPFTNPKATKLTCYCEQTGCGHDYKPCFRQAVYKVKTPHGNYDLCTECAINMWNYLSKRNPGKMKIHSEALESLKRYKDDLHAGHKSAAEYWRGQAGAYFTANPMPTEAGSLYKPPDPRARMCDYPDCDKWARYYGRTGSGKKKVVRYLCVPHFKIVYNMPNLNPTSIMPVMYSMSTWAAVNPSHRRTTRTEKAGTALSIGSLVALIGFGWLIWYGSKQQK